ncbi:hypothetical protein U1Q18_005723 [Sarracenia purpurea var. burkii]
MSYSGVRDLTKLVVTPEHNERSVAIKVDGSHGHRVSTNDVNLVADLDIPNPNGLVERVEDDEDVITIARASVPEKEGAFIGGGEDVVGIEGPDEVGDAIRGGCKREIRARVWKD